VGRAATVQAAYRDDGQLQDMVPGRIPKSKSRNFCSVRSFSRRFISDRWERKMIQATLTARPDAGVEPSVSGVSWAAVAAGAVASLALTLLL
jgi:hypothetical protein